MTHPLLQSCLSAPAQTRTEEDARLALESVARDLLRRPENGFDLAFSIGINEDSSGKKSAMRFSFRPSGEEGIVVDTHPDFFLENIQTNIAKGGVSWDMVVTLANPGDPVADPSAQWTGDHNEIVAARFIAEKAMAESDGRCDELNFDPTVLSDGFAPSEDPMLEVRSMIYALGVGKRLSEKE